MKMSLITKSLLIAGCLFQNSSLYAQESLERATEETQQVEEIILDELALLENLSSEQGVITQISSDDSVQDASDMEINAELEAELETELEFNNTDLNTTNERVELSSSATEFEKMDVSQIEYTRTLPNDGDIIIPTLENAKVFAKFTDTLPAVVNYYTKSSEAEIIDFYENFYGEAITQERKRGRLMVSYFFNQLSVRLVISTQNDFQQVDVMLEELM